MRIESSRTESEHGRASGRWTIKARGEVLDSKKTLFMSVVAFIVLSRTIGEPHDDRFG